jgi:hypothetical protein
MGWKLANYKGKKRKFPVMGKRGEGGDPEPATDSYDNKR